MDLQSTNESNNNTDNTSFNNNLELLNSLMNPMQLTTPLLITKQCDLK